jgi:hypothetical protein
VIAFLVGLSHDHHLPCLGQTDAQPAKTVPHGALQTLYFRFKLQAERCGFSLSAVGVPGEAYKLDFVFHSGEVYENNAGQDFFIAVEGGLDAASFAAWVGQQKREEQRRRLREKEAAQRAEIEKARQQEAVAQEARDREAAAAGEGEKQERAATGAFALPRSSRG